jgi:hypothetical protein
LGGILDAGHVSTWMWALHKGVFYPAHLQQIRHFSTNGTAPNVLLPGNNPFHDTYPMARYSALLGRRIEVTYRAGDVILPATGKLAADSGKSIFLEESYQQKNGVKTFRWEIPYPCIVQLNECPEIPRPSASLNAAREAAAESAPNTATLELKKNPA